MHRGSRPAVLGASPRPLRCCFSATVDRLAQINTNLLCRWECFLHDTHTAAAEAVAPCVPPLSLLLGPRKPLEGEARPALRRPRRGDALVLAATWWLKSELQPAVRFIPPGFPSPDGGGEGVSLFNLENSEIVEMREAQRDLYLSLSVFFASLFVCVIALPNRPQEGGRGREQLVQGVVAARSSVPVLPAAPLWDLDRGRARFWRGEGHGDLQVGTQAPDSTVSH